MPLEIANVPAIERAQTVACYLLGMSCRGSKYSVKVLSCSSCVRKAVTSELQSMGLQRVRYSWLTNMPMAVFMLQQKLIK